MQLCVYYSVRSEYKKFNTEISELVFGQFPVLFRFSLMDDELTELNSFGLIENIILSVTLCVFLSVLCV